MDGVKPTEQAMMNILWANRNPTQPRAQKQYDEGFRTLAQLLRNGHEPPQLPPGALGTVTQGERPADTITTPLVFLGTAYKGTDKKELPEQFAITEISGSRQYEFVIYDGIKVVQRFMLR